MSDTVQIYRSDERDARRKIFNPYADEDRKDKKLRKKEHPGEFNYARTGSNFSEIYEEAKSKNQIIIRRVYKPNIGLLIDGIDITYRLASYYLWWAYLRDTKISPVHELLISCFQKSLISIYTAFDLTLQGLYGAARPHLRFAFESLMIAKFCSTNPSSEVFDKWIDGLQIYFANGVLKKIKSPNTDGFKELWHVLSETTHSSIYGSQPDLALKDAQKDIDLNFALICLLSQWCYHLLGSHIITPSMRYHANRYAKANTDKITPGLRTKLRRVFKEQLVMVGKDTLLLLRAYRSKWVI